MLANPRGILRFADEIKGLIKGFGRYYSKSEGGERQAMLTAYRAMPYTINRIGFKDDSDGEVARIIQFFYASMAGGIQPDVADFLLEDEDDGYLARHWITFPDGVNRKRPHIPEDTNFLFEVIQWIQDHTEFAEGEDGLLVRTP